MLNIINNTSFSGAPKLRLRKGDKKRSIIVIRPTLKKIKSRLDAIRRSTRELKAELKRTALLDEPRQVSISQEILRLKQVKEGIFRYIENMSCARG